MNNTLISLDQVALIPKSSSSVNSRKEVYPFDDKGKLPLFVAPMTCIVNKTNYDLFNSRTYAILPVTPDSIFGAEKLSQGWFACPFDVFKKMVDSTKGEDKGKYFVCVDMADGHIALLYDYVKKFKEHYPNSEVMIGNIANAETYSICCMSGVDYVRVGIGGGNGCVTSVYTGFHNSIVNMLEDIKEIKQEVLSGVSYPKGTVCTKVVADGGIDSIGKAIKCLALGADYVMMGRLFAQCNDSAGWSVYVESMEDLYSNMSDPFAIVSPELEKRISLAEKNPRLGEVLVKEYYGQASTMGQNDRFGHVKSAPEGVTVYLPCTYTYKEFTDMFEARLRSAMSYNGSFNLQDFIGNVEWKEQSLSEFNSYNK